MTQRIQATGRRKTSTARVTLAPGNGDIKVNGRTLEAYFPLMQLQNTVRQPLSLAGVEGQYDIKINVRGGGITGQAEAVRHGLGRALVAVDEEYRPIFKPERILTRDSRMVERKKPGRKKARKNFQFSKR
jgi:small subunit ribosomal protein S9